MASSAGEKRVVAGKSVELWGRGGSRRRGGGRSRTRTNEGEEEVLWEGGRRLTQDKHVRANWRRPVCTVQYETASTHSVLYRHGMAGR